MSALRTPVSINALSGIIWDIFFGREGSTSLVGFAYRMVGLLHLLARASLMPHIFLAAYRHTHAIF